MLMRDYFNLLVAKNLKYYRLKAGFNQTELSKLCGLSRNSISSVENGVYSLTLYNAYRLAHALDIPVSMLFYDPFSIPNKEVLDEKTV